MTKSRKIHPVLEQDCHRILKLERCWILLHKNALVPWFIVVPETDETEFLKLPAELSGELIAICRQLAQWLLNNNFASKINFAAIGNIVPQMHLHVVGRQVDDNCWPSPVWGNLNGSMAYSEQKIMKIIAEIQDLFG